LANIDAEVEVLANLQCSQKIWQFGDLWLSWEELLFGSVLCSEPYLNCRRWCKAASHAIS
jgi:hypothetical protein